MKRRSFLGMLIAAPIAAKVAPQVGYDWKTVSVPITVESSPVSDVDYWTNRILATRGDRPVHVDYWTQRMTATDQPWTPLSRDELRNVFAQVTK